MKKYKVTLVGRFHNIENIEVVERKSKRGNYISSMGKGWGLGMPCKNIFEYLEELYKSRHFEFVVITKGNVNLVEVQDV